MTVINTPNLHQHTQRITPWLQHQYTLHVLVEAILSWQWWDQSTGLNFGSGDFPGSGRIV
jgi:endonuclease III